MATIEDARGTLLRRAQRQALRARRARPGSNERQTCLTTAALFSGCVSEIDRDKKLRAHLETTDALSGGWRPLADAVITFVRKRDAKKAPHA